MSLTRRQTLVLVGGGVIAAAGVTATGFALTRTPEKALAPWGLAGSYGEARRDALSYAILAPNSHNLQPWLVELVGEDEVVLHVDRTRLLPETDPLDRQITISLGCFLEQLRLAATATGHAVDITPFPEGEPEGRLDDRPVARAVFRPGATPDPLLPAIVERRSAKVPYDMERVPDTAPFTGPDLATDGTTDPERVAALRDLCWASWRVEASTPAKHMESVDVMRLGKAEIEANPDGIELGGPMLEALMLAGLVTRDQLATPGTTTYEQGVAMYDAMIAGTPAFVWINTTGNTRRDQLEAGRRWLRLNLATTQAGLGIQPVSQCLQEYPEMAEHYAASHEMLAAPGETVQMLGRLGHAGPVPQTPRWSLDAKIRT